MLYEIVNPSDQMTIEADDPIVAGVAALYLGEGKIGLTAEDGTEAFPIMIFGGDEVLDQWLISVGIGKVDDLRAWALERRDEIAACLESVVYGSFSDRKGILATLKGKEHHEILTAMAAWNDEKRSSLNDFSRAAFMLAKRVREMEVETEDEEKAADE